MFYDVKIYYPKTRKIKTISSKDLSKNYWAVFEEMQSFTQNKVSALTNKKQDCK